MRALLLSGGADSTALCWMLRPQLVITFDYGQRTAAAELRASASIVNALKIEHVVIRAPLGVLGQGNMVDDSPQCTAIAPSPEWWPFRNQLLITMAAAVCIGRSVPRLMIGTVADDRVHADGQISFLRRMASLLSHQEGGLTLEYPAAKMTGRQLLEAAQVPARLLAKTHSCHISNLACGCCRGCIKAADVRQMVERATWPEAFKCRQRELATV